MADHLNKRITKLEEKVRHLEARAPRQYDPESASAHDYTQGHGEPTPRQASRANEGTNNSTNKADPGKHDSRPWQIRIWVWKPWKRGLSIVVGVAAIGYAIVTYYQWHEANRNFRIDQRPWLKIELAPDSESSNTKVSTTMTVGSNLVIPVRLKNIGKTIATDVRSSFAIQIAGPADKLFLPPDMTNPPRLDRPTHWAGITSAESGAIFPDQFHDLPISEVGGCPNNCGPIHLSQSEFDLIVGGNALIYIAGTTTYTDAFGLKHWTRFCSTIPNTHNAQLVCPQYNRADNNY